MTQKHSYKLYYFDTKGRGEPIRLIFKYFGVDFDDVRLGRDDDYKKGAPFGQLPYLDVDDGKHCISQSAAIMRYLAKSFRPGFAGKSRIDAAKCDMLVDTFWDLLVLQWLPKFEQDPAVAAVKLEAWRKAMPEKLEILQKYLRKNGGHYMIGNEITYTDLAFLYLLYNIEKEDSTALQKYALLAEYYDKVGSTASGHFQMKSLPQIAEYIQTEWFSD